MATHKSARSKPAAFLYGRPGKEVTIRTGFYRHKKSGDIIRVDGITPRAPNYGGGELIGVGSDKGFGAESLEAMSPRSLLSGLWEHIPRSKVPANWPKSIVPAKQSTANSHARQSPMVMRYSGSPKTPLVIGVRLAHDRFGYPHYRASIWHEGELRWEGSGGTDSQPGRAFEKAPRSPEAYDNAATVALYNAHETGVGVHATDLNESEYGGWRDAKYVVRRTKGIKRPSRTNGAKRKAPRSAAQKRATAKLVARNKARARQR